LNFTDIYLLRDGFDVLVVASVQSDSSDSEPEEAEPTTDETLLLECETSPSDGLCLLHW